MDYSNRRLHGSQRTREITLKCDGLSTEGVFRDYLRDSTRCRVEFLGESAALLTITRPYGLRLSCTGFVLNRKAHFALSLGFVMLDSD